MANAPMGPPLSPRETRRSGRRSAPSASTSTSKSPDSQAEESAPRPKEDARRPSLAASNSSGRSKRLRQEDIDESVDSQPRNAPPNGSTSAAHANGNGRAKRKGKEKEQKNTSEAVVDSSSSKLGDPGEDVATEAPEEEEQGITRCVCGSTGEDDPDAGEFMVQCETCKAWQHGLCMGYEAEDQLPDDDYHCEQCRPDLHLDLIKKLSKRGRHSSANSHPNSVATASRLSRSHSPSHLLKQPAKRRNTMNSRDAAFDESLKELIEATAIEAAAHDPQGVPINGGIHGPIEPEEDVEVGPGSRKKRKRPEDDAAPKKRTRSASTTSDRPAGSNHGQDEPTLPNTASTSTGPVTKSTGGRNRRGGGRKSAAAPEVIEGQEVPAKRSHSSRAKAASTPKRPPASHASHAPASTIHEHGTRRNNQSNGVNSSVPATAAEASRAYRNSHAYAVSQQPLFTSWNLPDYLAHLEPMLPTDVPRPLEVRGSGVGPSGRESLERTMERGVKVKWPSKRTSVGDMNKRVRALVEWVGREQAGAMDRGRRREALEKALKEAGKGPEVIASSSATADAGPSDPGDGGHNGAPMVLDAMSESPLREKDPLPPLSMDIDIDNEPRPSTMTMMEDLMKELINFQERFGPGAKNKERDRRVGVAV